jgi:hypothetical protein
MKRAWRLQGTSPRGVLVSERKWVWSLRWKDASLLQVTTERRGAWFTATTPAAAGQGLPSSMQKITWLDALVANLVEAPSMPKPTLLLSLRVMGLVFRVECYTALWHPASLVLSSSLTPESLAASWATLIGTEQDSSSSSEQESRSTDPHANWEEAAYSGQEPGGIWPKFPPAEPGI